MSGLGVRGPAGTQRALPLRSIVWREELCLSAGLRWSLETDREGLFSGSRGRESRLSDGLLWSGCLGLLWSGCLDLLWSGCLCVVGKPSTLPLAPAPSSDVLFVPSLLSFRPSNLSLCSQSFPGNRVRAPVRECSVRLSLLLPNCSSCHFGFRTRRCVLNAGVFEMKK